MTTDSDDALYDAISDRALEEFRGGKLELFRISGQIFGLDFAKEGRAEVTDFWCLGIKPPHFATLSFSLTQDGETTIVGAEAILEGVIAALDTTRFPKRQDAPELPLLAIEQAGGVCVAMLALGREKTGSLCLFLCHHPAIDPWTAGALLKEYLRKQQES